MIRKLFSMLLTVALAIGYIPVYIAYGGKAMDARKKLGKDKYDALLSLAITVLVLFWAVRLVLWLRSYYPADWETGVVYGFPGAYVLWFAIARIRGKRCIRAAQKLEQNTETAVDTSGSVIIPTKDGGELTITFKQVGSVSSQSDADALAKLLDVDISGKEESGEPEEPLTEDYCLGGHHVSGSNMHIGMTVRYEAATHTVIYSHWSSQDPQVDEVFPVPENVRTKQALQNFVLHSTPIPSVWMY